VYRFVIASMSGPAIAIRQINLYPAAGRISSGDRTTSEFVCALSALRDDEYELVPHLHHNLEAWVMGNFSIGSNTTTSSLSCLRWSISVRRVFLTFFFWHYPTWGFHEIFVFRVLSLEDSYNEGPCWSCQTCQTCRRGSPHTTASLNL